MLVVDRCARSSELLSDVSNTSFAVVARLQWDVSEGFMIMIVTERFLVQVHDS